MSIEADFTPPVMPPDDDKGEQDAAFPLSTSLNIVFSAYEDRLVLRSRRVNRDPINVLLTRRMTIIVLGQLLANLPDLSGLDKTPTQYWQEVLQMAHQTALDSGRSSKAESKEKAESEVGEPSKKPAKKPGRIEGAIYLATSLTMQRKGDQLILAFSGLPMPAAMTEPREREPLFAIPLQVEHVHQMIQLIIDKAQEADWHLPVNMPWLESPADVPAPTIGLVH